MSAKKRKKLGSENRTDAGVAILFAWLSGALTVGAFMAGYFGSVINTGLFAASAVYCVFTSIYIFGEIRNVR